MWQPNLLHRKIHWHLPSPLLFPPTTKNPNTKQVHKGHPTVYTSLKCTIAANYDCTNKELKELNEAVSDALPHVVTWPGLDKTALKHHLLHLAKIHSHTTIFHLTTNCTIKSQGRPWGQNLYQKHVTHQILEHLIKNLPHKNKIRTCVQFQVTSLCYGRMQLKMTSFFHTANNYHQSQHIHTFIKATVISRICTNPDPDSPRSKMNRYKAKLIKRGYKLQEIEWHFNDKIMLYHPRINI